MRRASRGWNRVPPLATALNILATCTGVASTNPWPMLMLRVSPGYQDSFQAFCFHSADGIRPDASPGRSMPVASPIPSSRA